MDEGAKQRVSEVFAYEARMEQKKSDADKAIDQALKDWADGKISKETADAIITPLLETREKIDPAGSCLAITMAREDGYFVSSISNQPVREKLQTVTKFNKVVETAAEDANNIFDKTMADFAAGLITKEKANEIISGALKAQEALEPAGSCRAMTVARASGHFVGRI